jgi:hypothetical protein
VHLRIAEQQRREDQRRPQHARTKAELREGSHARPKYHGVRPHSKKRRHGEARRRSSLVMGGEFPQIVGMNMAGALGWSARVVAFAFATSCTPLAEDPELTERMQRAEEVVAAHCSSTDDCECSVTVSQSGCEATLTADWRARLQAGIDRELTYDAECFDTIEAGIADAECAWPPDDDRHPCHDHCQIFHGSKAEGESCKRFDDLVSNCAQGLLCDAGRCISPCERLSGLAVGEVCRDPVTFEELDRCADGLTCLGQTGRCAVAPAAGEACLGGECDANSYCDYYTGEICRARVGEGGNCDNASCQPGLYCAYSEGPNGFSATCRRRGEEGDPCFEADCAAGLQCNYEQGICAAPASAGQSCQQIDCDDDTVCDYDIGGICVAPPGPGQTCVQGECARGAWCDTTPDVPTCVPDLALAVACTGHSQCESGYCPAGFCDVRPKLGESCAGSLVCEIGASCDGQICRESVTRGPAVCVYEGW